jgi:hypothetical protein
MAQKLTKLEGNAQVASMAERAHHHDDMLTVTAWSVASAGLGRTALICNTGSRNFGVAALQFLEYGI